jgi:quercetin dioxygenase-like cupin family protein
MNTVHLPDIDAAPLERLFDDTEPRTNLLELAAGEEVPEHSHPDRTILFYVIQGEISLRVGEATTTLRAGDLARFDGEQTVSPAAETESRALVVLAARTREGPEGDG